MLAKIESRNRTLLHSETDRFSFDLCLYNSDLFTISGSICQLEVLYVCEEQWVILQNSNFHGHIEVIFKKNINFNV